MRGRDILLSSMVFCSGFSRSLIYKLLTLTICYRRSLRTWCPEEDQGFLLGRVIPGHKRADLKVKIGHLGAVVFYF
jgi:hypothetical protein